MAPQLMGINGPSRRGPSLMDHLRHQFLACAGFAGDVHRRLAACHLGDQTAHLLDGRRFAQQAPGTGRCRERCLAPQSQRRGDQFTQVVQIKRLGNEIKGAQLERLYRGLDAAVGRDHRDRNARRLSLNPLDQFQSAAIGKPHIGQTQIHGALGQGCLGAFHISAGSRLDVHAVKGDRQQLADIRLIVNHQRYGVHNATLSSSASDPGR